LVKSPDELEEQISRTPPEPVSNGVPGEHLNLIALLNCFGFNPMSKREAIQQVKELLAAGWNKT